MDELFEYTDSLNAPFEAFKGNFKVVKPHWHYFTEMIYVVKGKLITEVEGKVYTLHPGDLIIFFPKQIHAFVDYPENKFTAVSPEMYQNLPLTSLEDNSYLQNNNDELLFYGIKFDGMILSNTTPGSPKLPKLLENANTNVNPLNLVTANDLRFNPVKLFFENCIWETTNKQFGYDIKVASTISLIVTELIRIWHRHGFEFSTTPTFDQFSTKDFSVLEYIDKHSSENISVEDLASKCGMCYSNFAKQFKTHFGRTCKEYIEFVRICKADNLLLYTDKTLDYISQETGFTDASHFIRTYKKIRGITPKQRRMSKRH